MSTFFLVHGAFQGGWVWRKIRPLLEERGHRVHAPTLPGCGYLAADQSQAQPNLTTAVETLTRYLEFEDLQEVVLVAHSFSGMFCGALLNRVPERISRILCIDAIIPRANSSFAALAGPQFAQMLEGHRIDQTWVRPWPVQVFGIGVDDAAWFAANLRPFPYQTFHEPFPGAFQPALRPVHYISCQQTASPFIREMANQARHLGWPVSVLDSGHCPMISSPESLVALMIEIVPR